jgi:pullulanase/glycogen debranching enzyme
MRRTFTAIQHVIQPSRSACVAHSRDSANRHIRHLGVTSAELLPIQAFVNDSYLADNNTLRFFAADPRLFAQGPGAIAEE